MHIIVMPKYQATQFTCEKPWAVISINNYGATDFPEFSTKNRVGVLKMGFDDTNVKHKGSFCPNQAKEIIDFVSEFCSKIDILLIHCHMGMSRSPAVAAAIYKLLTNENDSFYFRSYTPNTLVYNIILDVGINQMKITPGQLAKSPNINVND